MIEYKQWHESLQDFIYFNSECAVSFCQCDKNHKLSLFELLRLVTDVAVEDFNQRLMGYEKLTENNVGILLSRQSFRFHKMPVVDQKICIKTWEEKPEPLLFVRAYEIFDKETGEKLVSGISNWLLVDLQKRRLMPIKNFTMRKAPEKTSAHDCIPLTKILVPDNLEKLGERKIMYSDIDGNGHMNNARYGAFVIDALPEEFQNISFTDFKIYYNKEAVQGQMLEIFGSIDSEHRKVFILGKQGNVNCFESELYY